MSKNHSQKLLAVVPARGGSRDIPLKNIIKLGGHPLIHYSLAAAFESESIGHVIVSSDSSEILSSAQSFADAAPSIYGDATPGFSLRTRPKEASLDTSHVSTTFIDLFEHAKEIVMSYDYFIILMPTSPLRRGHLIDEAFTNLLAHGEADTLLSAKPYDSSAYKLIVKTPTSPFLQPLINEHAPYLNRQQVPPLYLPDGCLSIFSTKRFASTHVLFSPKLITYDVPDQYYANIDTFSDLAETEKMVKKIWADFPLPAE